jgi:topoisomerase-4 subunit A
MGKAEETLLLASDAGYGFLATLSDLYAKNRAGKALLTLPQGAYPLPPLRVSDPDTEQVCAISNEGRMLLFPVRDLPMLSKGKGNKIIQIPPARLKERKEYVSILRVVPEGAHLIVHVGKRFMTLKGADLAAYRGERGRRGKFLSRGFRNVERLEAVIPGESDGTDEGERGQLPLI